MTIYGIRHHGPGCARSLRTALEAQQPDLVLIEGPPDADALVGDAAREGMTPPVAILLYAEEEVQRAAFYPFAEFSPEWQALQWAASHEKQARFFDLPSMHRFAIEKAAEAQRKKRAGELAAQAAERAARSAEEDDEDAESIQEETPRSAHHDPLQWLARADGYSDSERWWNDRVEQRRDDADLFAAILEALTALRNELALPESRVDLLREAWMRRAMREAKKEGFSNIAVVCGAWHAPALAGEAKVSEDNALLKGLPKLKVRATWAPWTYERLTSASGYGAGVDSPGWYEHLWKGGAHLTESWLTRSARVLRGKGLDASSASVIECVRLSEALAGMRGRPLPGLPELTESMRSVLCGGDAAALGFLHRPLMVGEKLGTLPEGLAKLPLQQDIEAQQKSLRLKPAASATPVELDLREPGGQARSVFLHRLLALEIPWGQKGGPARGKGTFKELWALTWKPELTLSIVDASAFGNTVATAAAARLAKKASEAKSLDALVPHLESSLLADLPDAAELILAQTQAAAASGDDTLSLLRAIPPLAQVTRYGNVRQSDVAQVRIILLGIAARAHVGLPSASVGLDADAARELTSLLRAHHAAVTLLEDGELAAEWRSTLRRLADQATAHPQARGLSTRLLRDVNALDADAVAGSLSFALSSAQPPVDAVAWLEGFLTGGGAVLIHDRTLLRLLNAWVAGLNPEHFQNTLPLLRRTFTTFSPPERASIGQAVKQIDPAAPETAPTMVESFAIDGDRASAAIRRTAELLGILITPAAP